MLFFILRKKNDQITHLPRLPPQHHGVPLGQVHSTLEDHVSTSGWGSGRREEERGGECEGGGEGYSRLHGIVYVCTVAQCRGELETYFHFPCT